MAQLQLLWAWAQTRVSTLRNDGERDQGFGTLEWVALAGIIIVIAIAVATLLMNKAKTAAGDVNLQ